MWLRFGLTDFTFFTQQPYAFHIMRPVCSAVFEELSSVRFSMPMAKAVWLTVPQNQACGDCELRQLGM